MKRLLSDYCTKWYIPVLVSVLVGFLCLFIITLPYEITFYIALGLPFTALVISCILGIMKLFKKLYLQGILQIIATVALGITGTLFLVVYMMFYPYDFYADNLEIPHSLKLEIPKKYRYKNDHFKKSTDFELYNSFQPGIYTYDISINKTGKGIVFLKAYEVTQKDQLSIEELKLRSAITVKPSDTIIRYRLKDDFTIYEGDWSHPYAARFEMWFRSDATGKETKLAQKYYKIEGWMR
jgi:hypothetical protein